MNTYDFAHRSDRASGSKALSDDTRRTHSPLYGAGGLSAMAQADELRALQMRADGDPATADPHAVAAQGVSGVGGRLPHADRIQAAFGRHDISDVQAHVGGAAQHAAMALNAQAYATGRSVAFARAPDLHTAAHEAAHVVQQRGGVSLKGGVGQAGDAYEQHADAVADAVVAGRSAEDLLGQSAGTGGGGAAASGRAVQKRGVDWPAYDTVTGFVNIMHPGGRDQRYAAPTAVEAKPITFAEVHPGETGPGDGMPEPIDLQGALVFVRSQREEDVDGRTRRIAPVVVDRTRAEETGSLGQMLLGQQVDQLDRWCTEQRDAADRIKAIDAHFATLRENGIVGDDYALLDGAAVTRMLGRVAKSGRPTAYRGLEADRSDDVMNAGRIVVKQDIALSNHNSDIARFGARARSLQSMAAAASSDAEAHFAHIALSAAESDKAALERKKRAVLMWTTAAFDVASSGVTIWKGVADMLSKGGGTDEGQQTSMSGAIGVLKVIGTVTTNLGYGTKLATARTKVAHLRTQLRSHQHAALLARLDALEVEFASYQAAIAHLDSLTGLHVDVKQKALAHFGSVAAKSLATMRDQRSVPKGDPFSGRNSKSRGRIQHVFANMLDCDAIASLAGATRWPKLRGIVPLGGYLASRERTAEGVLRHIGVEASKLRWWQLRIAAISQLSAQAHAAVAEIDDDTRRQWR